MNSHPNACHNITVKLHMCSTVTVMFWALRLPILYIKYYVGLRIKYCCTWAIHTAYIILCTYFLLYDFLQDQMLRCWWKCQEKEKSLMVRSYCLTGLLKETRIFYYFLWKSWGCGILWHRLVWFLYYDSIHVSSRIVANTFPFDQFQM